MARPVTLFTGQWADLTLDEDGYRTVVVCDAILASAAARKQVDIKH